MDHQPLALPGQLSSNRFLLHDLILRLCGAVAKRFSDDRGFDALGLHIYEIDHDDGNVIRAHLVLYNTVRERQK